VRNAAGLTFIELTIVILIIGLVMAVAAPNLVGFLRSTKAGSAARQLAGYFRYMEDKAVRENRQFVIVFDKRNHGYWAATEVREEDLPTEYYYSSESDRMEMKYPAYRDREGLIGPVRFENDVRIRAILNEENFEARHENYHMVYVNPDGTATRTTIYLGGPREEVLTVFIKPFTAEVEIYDTEVRIPPLPDSERIERDEELLF
jgi:Tfp pilus assembly protein PilE